MSDGATAKKSRQAARECFFVVTGLGIASYCFLIDAPWLAAGGAAVFAVQAILNLAYAKGIERAASEAEAAKA